MNQQERDEVVSELSVATGLRCYYDNGDFVLFRKRESGVYRQLIIKEKSPWVLAYGSKYTQVRRLMGRILADLNLPDSINEVDDSSPKNDEAVWCRIKFNYDRNWYDNRMQLITGASTLYKKFYETGILGPVEDFRQLIQSVGKQSFTTCGVPIVADSSSDYQKLMLKNGGMDPAIVQVDTMEWPQSDYAEDVKELSELDPDVLSWVSTVEEVAKKSAVGVKGVLVKPAKLRIPPYQRKFTWKERDVRQLCKDLLKEGDDGNYHLGTVILHHERKNGEEIWNVVDGQQRLTSIMAILGAPIFDLPIKQFLMCDYLMIRQVMADYSEDEQLKIRERLARCTLAFISVENVSEAFQLFTTQNGRGKPLTPVNLLKAYHYKAMEVDRQRMDADDFERLLNRVECEWESANVASTPGDGKLLLHVFREYLFRLRLWSRGKFPQDPFDASNIGEFKGVTIKGCEEGLPLQNGAVLRTYAQDTGDYVVHRLPDDNMNPYVSICQTIVNGADFFKYAQAYVAAYKNVFVDRRAQLEEFRRFYLSNCRPEAHKSGAAMYARHVFEALCLFCYDRFGSEGLTVCYRSLFASAYFERISQTRVLYRRCGSAYAPRAIEAMMTNYSIADVQDALSELRSEIRLALNSVDYVKSLLKKEHPTRGEAMQCSAYETIMK